MEIETIYIIGFGLVATALLEIFNLEKVYYKCKFIIIEPEPIKLDLFNNREYKHIREYITEENKDELLKDCNNKSLIIDLTVETDSIMIIKKSKECNSFYINTSVENWEEFDDSNRNMDNYQKFKKNTIYYRQKQINKLLKDTNKTRIINFGMNPGGISEIAKITIKKYAKTKNKKLINGDYAKLVDDLQIKKILICEYDNTQTNIKQRKDTFYNDWSPLGLTSEAIDNIMISLNKDDENNLIEEGYNLIKPEEDNTRIRFLPKKAIDLTDIGYCFDNNENLIEFEGYLIPHSEIISLSNFLYYKKDSPTIFYIYRPCDDALISIDKVKENNYKPLQNFYCIEQKDIINNCFDSIGVLLITDNDMFWGGTILDLEYVKNLGVVYSTPTSLQVAGWIFSCIRYIFKNQKIGLNEAETLKSAELMKYAKKYMGKLVYKFI